MPEYRKPGMPESRNTGIPEYRNTGNPETRNTGNPEYRKPGNPETRKPGIPEYRNTGIPETRKPGNPETRKPGNPETRDTGIPEYQSFFAEPAFLPVVDCDGITALRHYELGFWQNRHSCPWWTLPAIPVRPAQPAIPILLWQVLADSGKEFAAGLGQEGLGADFRGEDYLALLVGQDLADDGGVGRVGTLMQRLH